MSRIAWHRPARIAPPVLPSERVLIPLPPQVQVQSNSTMWVMMLMPLLSSISIAAYMFTYHSRTLTFVAVGIIFVSVAITAGVRFQMRATMRGSRERRRQRYLDHLTLIRDSARTVAAAQRAAASWQWPGPERLWAIASGQRRVWERRPDDPDFLRVRAGLGRGPLATPLQLSSRVDPTVEYDAELLRAAQRLVESYATIGRQPATVDLRQAGVVSIVGEPGDARAACRALLGQLAVLHAPDDVTLAISADGDVGEWAWATWLPHAREPGEQKGLPGDTSRPALVAAGFDGLADVVERELARAQEEKSARRGGLLTERRAVPSRHVVIVLDAFHSRSPWARTPLGRRLIETAGPDLGITVIALVTTEAEEPSRVGARLRLGPGGRLSLDASQPRLISEVTTAVADRPAEPLSEATARALAPLILTEEREQALTRAVPLTELLGLADIASFDPTAGWLTADDHSVLRAPIGVTGDGEPIVLDLKESAQGGMGPHGLVVGATGSGKSELLRTLLTGLTMTHSPDLLSLVLVDFKGGATFAGMTDLPHVAGLITNLADDLALVERVRDALIGEQQRRQQILRDAGNVDSLREYQLRQAAGGLDTNGRPLEPLPYLLVIVDEFGELLSSQPDFINVFVQIGRVGRSLGIHLLLATQRLEEGRLRGLESHLSYRLCLRTFSAMESRTVIGTTDAYRLPHLPGSAYLKVGESVYERFRVAHVSAPYEESDVAEEQPAAEARLAVLGPREAPSPEEPEQPAAPVPVPGGPTQMQVVVDRLRRFGQPVHQVWLPPLPPAIPLDALLGPLTAQDDRGLQAAMWPLSGSLRFPAGVVDLPVSQEQQPLVLDFGQMHPHVVLVGAPQSGKSTFLRTVLLSAMLTHTPRELQFSGLDYGGGALFGLARAPHVSGVAVRGEEERARRVLAEALRLISQREALFRQRGISSAAEFRRLRDDSQLPEDVNAADVCVVIDNWGGLRDDLPDVDTLALGIAARGPGAGVHLLLTANRWGDIRMNLRDAIGARLELRLNDPSESEVNRRAARLVPSGLPGRGISPPGVLFQALLPRADGQESTDGLGEAQDEILGKIIASWPGPAAPPVRLLPEAIHLSDLPSPDPAAAEAGALVAIGERDLAPVRIDLTGTDQHCLVIGDGGAGKSTFIRTLMKGLAASHPPQAVRFMVVDYRRALLDAVPAPYIGAYAGDSGTAQAYAVQLAATLAQRMPPTGISQRQLRERSWWSGPELYLVVDDYDLIAGMQSPLAPVTDYIAQGREIGFHLVVARRSGGIARAMMTDPVISRVRELGAVSMLLSADPREGVIAGGVRGADLPPGRGVLVRRRQDNELVQVVLSDEPQ